MRSDVAEDSAVPLPFEEPRRPGLRRHLVRAHPDRLDDPANRSALHQLAGADGGAVLEPFAVHDRVDAFGLRLHLAHFGELLERRDSRLVDHVVLAVLHHADPERRALVGNAGADHQLDRLVLEDLVLGAGDLGLREALDESLDEIRFLRVDRHQLAAAANCRGRLAVDVAVIQADDREPDLARRLRHGRRRLPRGLDPQPVSGAVRREDVAAERGNDRRGAGELLEKIASANPREFHVVLERMPKMPKLPKSASALRYSCWVAPEPVAWRVWIVFIRWLLAIPAPWPFPNER